MGRLFTRAFRQLGALLAGLALLVAAPAFAETTFTYTLPSGQKGVIVLPPVEEFQEGDQWEAYAADATTDMNANTAFKGQVAYSFAKTNGAWAQANLDFEAFMKGEASKGRHFRDLGRDPPDYPETARPGQLFATQDGILHRFDGAQWETIPIGTTIDAPDGKHLTIDRRVLPAEAARVDAAFQRAEAAVAAQKAQADADAQAAQAQQAQQQAQAQQAPTPAADPAQTTITPPSKTDDPPKGGAAFFLLVILIIAGAWVWWWFGPRRKALQAKAAAATGAPDTPAE